MRFFFNSIVILLFTCVLNGCQSPNPSTSPEVVSTWIPEYAMGFHIDSLSDGSKRLVLFNLEHFPDTLETIDIAAPKNYKLTCMSTTHLAMLRHLKLLNHVQAVGFADMVRNPEVRALIDAGKIQNLTNSEDISTEMMVALQPDYFFVYPFSHTSYAQIAEKGIRCVPVSEYLETHPLGRAEWIVFFGALLHEEQNAHLFFNQIKQDYEALASRVSAANDSIPTVFTGSSEQGMWYAPSGNSFVGHLLQDAGARYIYADSLKPGNLSLPMEKLISDAYRCDYWGKVIYTPGEPNLQSILDDDGRLAKIKSYQAGRIFYCNASETDYFGDALMEPQVLLADLVHVFHPQLNPEHQPVFFKTLN
jgi:iron complex transport system substrate-binding protein